MSKKIISFIFLVALFFYQFSHAEIVTLDDGRVVKLHEDGTFTVLLESNTDTNTNNNSSFEDSIINIFDLLGIQYETVNYVNNSNLVDKKGKPRKLWLDQFTNDIGLLVKKKKQVVIGEIDKYEARCRTCFTSFV